MKRKNHSFSLKVDFVVIGFLSLATQCAQASAEQERVYLLQLLHQIDAMQSTVSAAAKEQSQDARIQFHYTAYRDKSGRLHNGVSEDLQLIRSGIEEQLDHASVEPKMILPINGDYNDQDKSENVK
jgi:RAQPRD family integrative conjugative element protein